MRWLAATLLVLTGTAAADDDEPETTPVIQPTRVTASLAGHTAHIVIRVTRKVMHGTHNEFEIEMPSHGVITKATAHVEGHAHVLALESLEPVAGVQDKAEPKHRGGAQPWIVTVGRRSIDIAAPHAGSVALDLEIEAPTCYSEDRRYVDLPDEWKSVMDPALHVQASPADTCAKDFALAASWPVNEQQRALDRTIAHGERLDLSQDHFAHVEVDLAARLSEVPADLATVFVVDASRSITPDTLHSMQLAIASYAEHAPNSRIQVVAYAREARALLPAWSTARDAAPRIAHELANLTLANGSNPDAGLVLAGTLLKNVSGTRRVVLFDDELLPDRVVKMPAANLRHQLPANTLVHVVGLGFSTDEPMFQRDDALVLAPLAAATEGWAAFLIGETADATRHLDAEELLRPRAIENVTLKTSGWETYEYVDKGTDCLDNARTGRLVEGSACEWWGHSDKAADTITFEGLAWNHPVRREITLVRDNERVARTISGHHDASGDPELLRAAHAVNDNWALTAEWGGTGSYPDDDSNVYGGVTCGCEGEMNGGFGVGPPVTPVFRTQVEVERQVAAAVKSCHAGHASVELELTMTEIVGVTVTAAPRDRDCITEAVWGLALTRNNPIKHERVVVKI
ncbi:MAG: VWA domain-containing protein [Kofleriaceae bacterium]